MIKYGIRNLTLWYVGAALLQIDLWEYIPWGGEESEVRVRKSLGRSKTLGKRYRQLTKRLVDCDFGEGDDLTSQELQAQIYNRVVSGFIRGCGTQLYLSCCQESLKKFIQCSPGRLESLQPQLLLG